MRRCQLLMLSLLVLATSVLSITEPLVADDSESDVLLLIKEVREQGVMPRVGYWMDDFFKDFREEYSTFKNDFRDQTKIDFGIQYSLTYQIGTQGGPDKDLLISNMDFFGNWVPFEDNGMGKTTVGWLFRDRREFLGTTTAQLQSSIGSVYAPNDTSVPDDRDLTALLQFWVMQSFAEDTIKVTLGKVDMGTYVNSSTYAGNDKTLFFATPLATNPVRDFPGEGLGGSVQYDPGDFYYLSFVFADANGDGNSSGFNTFGDGEFTYAGEIGLRPKFDGLKEGDYRFAVHYTDKNESRGDGWGFALSFDQQITDDYGLFLRYGISDEDMGDLEQVLGTGVMFTQPFGHTNDRIGFGLLWTRPTDSNVNDDFGFETFWRMQIAPHLQWTPGVQFIFDPSYGDDDMVTVFSLRLRWLF